MKSVLHGIIPPVITPLTSYNKIDEAGVEKLIEHLIKGGVHGLFLMGTNGEAVSLSHGLRKTFIDKVCKLVDHRIPVLVGITDTSLESALAMAGFCEEAGADMVVIAPPYYYPISQTEMMSYLDQLVPGLNLPFLLYDIPSHTKLHMTIETVKHARDMGAAGVKDSSGDLLYFYSLIEQFKNSPGFSVITGTEIFIPEAILHGGHGGIAGGANIFPELFVKYYNASKDRDYDKIKSLRQIVMKIETTIYNVSKFASGPIMGTKCALSVLGLCSDYMVPPLKRLEAEERNLIMKSVEEINEIDISKL